MTGSFLVPQPGSMADVRSTFYLSLAKLLVNTLVLQCVTTCHQADLDEWTLGNAASDMLLGQQSNTFSTMFEGEHLLVWVSYDARCLQHKYFYNFTN